MNTMKTGLRSVVSVSILALLVGMGGIASGLWNLGLSGAAVAQDDGEGGEGGQGQGSQGGQSGQGNPGGQGGPGADS